LVCLVVLQGVLPARAATQHRLPDGTRIAVRTMEQLSSATLKDNDPVLFSVVEDVEVDGVVVIKQGTPVRGMIIDAEAKRRMGRAGRLQYTVNETKGADRSTIRLRALQQHKGDSNVTSTTVTTVAVGVFVPVAAPLFLLRKGHDIVVPEGTRVDVFVDGDHVITPDAERPQTASVAAVSPRLPHVTAVSQVIPSSPPPPLGRLTNGDVLALHKAGFGDDLILAKIAASQPVFSVEPLDLVTLKKAGLSERVITAMVGAR